jgi:hypothetical protein
LAPLTPAREIWACALAIERRYVAERIGTLVPAGDLAGVERWKPIAHRLDALHSVPGWPVKPV